MIGILDIKIIKTYIYYVQVVIGPNDFNRFGMYINKAYKWGYFLETKTYDEHKLIEQKETAIPIILWVRKIN